MNEQQGVASTCSDRRCGRRIAVIVLMTIVAAAGAGWLARQRLAASSQESAGSANGEVAPADALLPVAWTSETEHDFGFLDWSEPCEFVFRIRNDGNAPLKLQRGATSCKCTMGDLPEAPVEPGESAAFRVASKLAPKPGNFSHTATVLTNDPKRPAIEFRIFGVVRAVLAAAPTTVRVVQQPGKSAPSGNTLVFSQVWDAMEVVSVSTPIEDVRWRWAPAEPEALEEWNAKCGRRLFIEFPRELPQRGLWGTLRIEAKPAGGVESRELEIELAGQVASRVAIQGPGYDADLGIVRLGLIRAGEEFHHRLTLKVADDHRTLTIRRIEVEPEFLTVALTPYAPDNPALGLYRLDLTVPPDAPPSDFMGARHGEVRIETDHPAVPLLHFDVHFVIVP